MARLPTPGGDSGEWGEILNDFLAQSLQNDGSLRSGVVATYIIADNAVTEPKLSAPVREKLNSISGSAGIDGREVELRATATHIQWRYTGGGAWTDIIALTSLQGPVGPKGDQGDPGTITWSGIPDKPASIAAGATNAAARLAIGAGTSDLVLGTTSTTAAAGNHLHDDQYVRTVNGVGPDGAGNVTVAGGGDTSDHVTSATISTIWTGTQAAYDAISNPESDVLYFIRDAG